MFKQFIIQVGGSNYAWECKGFHPYSPPYFPRCDYRSGFLTEEQAQQAADEHVKTHHTR